MDRLDELATFVAILDAGSLAEAGRRLRRSPPAVTRALAALEERLDARLVERTTRRLAPTEAGRRLAEQARQLLADHDELVREAAGAGGAPRGLLRVTAPLVFGRKHVLPLVAAFLGAYPAVQIEVVLSDRNLDLVGEGLDVAVRIGRLADSGLIARWVGEVRRVLVASPAYLAARSVPRNPRDLASHDAVLTSSRSVPLEWRFRSAAGRERVVRPLPKLVVNEVEAALVAVRAGRGVTSALSYQVADDLASGALVRLLADWEPPPLPVHLIAPSARHMPPRVRAFLDHMARELELLVVIRAKSLPCPPP